MESFFCSLQEKEISLSGEHVREGLTCVVSVKVPNPEFEGQTKVLLLLCWSAYYSFHHPIYFPSFHITSISLLHEDKVGKSRGAESG